MVNIALPNKIGVENISPDFLQSLIVESEEEIILKGFPVTTTIKKPSVTDVVLDFTNLRFVQPSGITLLSNLVHWLRRHSVNVSHKGYNKYVEAHKFLDQSKFFDVCFAGCLNNQLGVRSTTKPLKVFERSRSHAWINFEVIPWLGNITQIGSPSLGDLKACLQEMLNNIDDHSSETIGSTFAQFYPNNNSVVISISDFGIGIPSRVRSYLREVENAEFRDRSDAWYITKACERGFTTKSTAGNQGNGLSYLVDNVLNRYQGKIIILSERAKVTMRHNQATRSTAHSWVYPGCLIEMHIPTHRIPVVDEGPSNYEW